MSLSKEDSSLKMSELPYSPFHAPFLKGEWPFSKGEWASEKKIHPSKRVNVFTLEGEPPFLKGEQKQ